VVPSSTDTHSRANPDASVQVRAIRRAGRARGRRCRPTCRGSRQRDAFPDFRPEIHSQTVDADIVTTCKTYHGTRLGDFLGIAPNRQGHPIRTVDAMRVRDGKITDHWE
jgi:predicted ester cyclase